MKAKIEANGNVVEIELTPEQVKVLGLNKDIKTGWERADYGSAYYFISDLGNVNSATDYNNSEDNEAFQSGNYFTDKNLAKKMSKRINLMLKIQRWADTHNTFEEYDEAWDDTEYSDRYTITFNRYGSELEAYIDYHMCPFDTYFSSEELAEQAIKIFGNELKEVMVIKERKN